MRGADSDRWADVREALPLLQQQEWHSQTRHGYARGGEPVIYVRNIRRYYEILDYLNQSQQRYPLLDARFFDEEEGDAFQIIPPLP
jgi:membrane-bound lytic murein transglycosylase F